MLFMQRVKKSAERVGMRCKQDAIVSFDRTRQEPPVRLHVAHICTKEMISAVKIHHSFIEMQCLLPSSKCAQYISINTPNAVKKKATPKL